MCDQICILKYIANNSFNYDQNGACQVKDYTKKSKKWYQLWPYVTGCPASEISLTAMFIFLKDYNTYAIWALFLFIPYCSLLFFALILGICSLIFQNDVFESNIDYILQILSLYNLLVSQMLLYLLYKPLQYNKQSVNVPITGGDPKTIQCEISSIRKRFENFLDWIAFISFCAVIIQVLYTFIRIIICIIQCIKSGCICCNTPDCCRCFCKCEKDTGTWNCCNFTICKRANFGATRTMSIESARRMHQYGTKWPCCLIAPHKHCSKYCACRNICLILTIAFFGMITVAYILLLVEGIENVDQFREDHGGQAHGISVSLILLVISFVLSALTILITGIRQGECVCNRDNTVGGNGNGDDNANANQQLIDDDESENIPTYGL